VLVDAQSDGAAAGAAEGVAHRLTAEHDLAEAHTRRRIGRACADRVGVNE